MIEKWIEIKELIKAGKNDEAIAIIDEMIAATPEMAKSKPYEPMPGDGTNGLPPKHPNK